MKLRRASRPEPPTCKLILAACFITDLGTVLALGGFFASYGWLLIVFVAVSAAVVAVLPRLLRLAIRHLGHRVSEPEIKLLLVVLFGLGGPSPLPLSCLPASAPTPRC